MTTQNQTSNAAQTRNTSRAAEADASTTEKVAHAAHDAIDGAARKAQPVEKQIRQQAYRAHEQLDATQAAAMEHMEESLRNIEKFVKQRPVAATGIAFAAGALAAIMLRR